MEAFEKLTLEKTIEFKNIPYGWPNMFNFCLSKDFNSNVLWDRYNGDVCIEFNPEFFRRALDYYPPNKNKSVYTGSSSLSVIYQKEQQEEIIRKVISNSFDEYNICKTKGTNIATQDIFDELFIDFILCSYVFKDTNWSDENEYRFFLDYSNRHNSEDNIKYDNCGNPYIELQFKDKELDDIWNAFLIKIWARDETVFKSLKDKNIDCEIIR